MIINGTNINTFFSPATGMQGKAAAAAAKGLFTKRSDTFELSNFFKKISNADENKSQAAEIQKMLAKTENNNAKTMADGVTGYAYMEISLVREAMKTETDLAKFNYYSEEKAYYQGLLDEADGARRTAMYDDYEYICKDNESVDREKALKALANVQSRIDSLINGTQETGGSRTDIQTYNRCASSFAKAFGVDNSKAALSEDNYNKLFGKIEATEENYIQKCSEKASSLWKCYDTLKEQMDNSIEKMRAESGGEERAKAVKNAFAQAYGNSLSDIMDLIDELQLTAKADI